MDSKKVLYFLDLLNRETTGHSAEIASIYNRALNEDDDVMHLKRLLNEYSFYGEIGSSLVKNGSGLLEALLSDPSRAQEILPRIRQAHKSIDNEAGVCDKLMRSPLPFTESITVLKNKDTIDFMGALNMVANAAVYLMIVYEGIDSVRTLTWDDRVGIQEMIYAVNTKFIPALCDVKRPNYSWVIRRNRLGGKALFGGDAYYLSYESNSSVEAFSHMLYKEAMGTHAYLNIGAYESGEYNTPLCWGIGNIISARPDNATSFLQRDIASKLRSPNRVELQRKVPTPFECVRQLSDGKMFCITPDELVLAMNRWQVGHEIEMRRRNRVCLFCGRPVGKTDLVCRTHFTTEL